ncbi:hypothetical protein Nepgr_033736 [Nepenthes gracilis]|uniref:Uncharacterized protein n=1 Tax=Nepenthes gracilis TaxID=150966 RepID=A0AAD3TN03_NEPGR|nr:hypothetical protein Nepgr_033736 [Nepenthes gracilis]
MLLYCGLDEAMPPKEHRHDSVRGVVSGVPPDYRCSGLLYSVPCLGCIPVESRDQRKEYLLGPAINGWRMARWRNHAPKKPRLLILLLLAAHWYVVFGNEILSPVDRDAVLQRCGLGGFPLLQWRLRNFYGVENTSMLQPEL